MTQHHRQTSKARLSIDCSPEERKQIKLFCAMNDKTISQWVMECVREKIQAEIQLRPNKKTEQALRDSRKGEGVITYDSIEELFDDLGF